ncbi:MAG: DUF4271 domain-containing protein [Anditalea sp.]
MNDKIKSFLIFKVAFFSCLSWANGQIFENYNPRITKEEGTEWYKSPVLARVFLDLEDFPLASISVTVPGNASVFIDGVMWFFAEKDTSLIIGSQDLRERFPSTEGNRELTIYKKGVQIEEISIKKGIFEEGTDLNPDEESPEITSLRERDVMNEFFFIAVLIIFLLISMFKVIYPLVLSFIIRPVSVFSTEDFSESSSLKKLFSEEILFFLLIFNMLLMLLIMVSVNYLNVIGLENLLLGDLNYMFFVWLSGTGVLLLISLIKFIWLKISAIIFGINKFEFTHFFYMLRITSVILIAIFSILIISMTNDFLEVEAIINHLLLGLFFVYFFGTLMLFFMMTKKVSFKNYHLFSYLCTAELIPFLVLSKLIIG